MFGKKKLKKAEYDQQLLTHMNDLKQEWITLRNIMEQSIDFSEKGTYDLHVVEAKYYYLLREARYRKLSARGK